MSDLVERLNASWGWGMSDEDSALLSEAADSITALEAENVRLKAHPWPVEADYQLGDLVEKKGRAKWRGRIVGWYRTEITSLGYAIESIYEPGSVQIYPETAIQALTQQGEE